MIMIWWMIKVIVFTLCLGFGLAVLIFVPLTIYNIPYLLWLGSQNVKGKHMDKKVQSIRATTKHATRLYKAILLRREPIF